MIMSDAMYGFFGGGLQDVFKAVRLLSGGCHRETISRTKDRRAEGKEGDLVREFEH